MQRHLFILHTVRVELGALLYLQLNVILLSDVILTGCARNLHTDVTKYTLHAITIIQAYNHTYSHNYSHICDNIS